MAQAERDARRTYGGSQQWVLTSDELPPDGVEVETLGAQGTQQIGLVVVRAGRLDVRLLHADVLASRRRGR